MDLDADNNGNQRKKFLTQLLIADDIEQGYEDTENEFEAPAPLRPTREELSY